MTRTTSCYTLVRVTGGILLLATLAACGQGGPSSSAGAKHHSQNANRTYVAPGPAADPWGPYIREACARFDVPEVWVRSLMRVESGGRQAVTSHAGAMGLMQVMPGTYDELRERHNLGDDPYNPQDNILAGVAYMREMYDIYGAPGFLAAYNGGPARLDDYLTNNRPLPDETRRYVAMIGPNIVGVWPKLRSPAEAYAMNSLPVRIPPGTRFGRQPQYAAGGSYFASGRVPASAPVVATPLPVPPAAAPPRGVALVEPPPPPARSTFSLIPSAHAAEPVPFRRPNGEAGQWAIQVGAYANQSQAQAALGIARDRARAELAVAQSYVGMVHQARGVALWRARLTGLSREAASQACEKLSRGRTSCIVLSPEAQQS